MNENKVQEIEKAFEIAKMFVKNPELFDQYPDGSQFFIGDAGAICKDCGEAYSISQVHVSVNPAQHANFKMN